MLKPLKADATSFSLSGPVKEAHLAFAPASSETSAPKRQAVMLQGAFVRNSRGGEDLMVAADPRVVERKLTIRAINAGLEGRMSGNTTSKR